jgi:ZIP family zinc transporter
MTYGMNAKRKAALINYSNLLVLGGFAGLTIFLGLPLAVMQRVSLRVKGFLNAFAIGILIFLIVDVFSHAWESVSDAATGAFAGSAPVGDAALNLIALFGGMAVGLLGLTWYGSHYMRGSFVRAPVNGAGLTGTDGKGKQELQIMQQVETYRLSMMIAVGIGAHNFSEGLAIGQSYVSGALGLAFMLIVGFAAHNATEGFGIAAPLTGLSKKPSVRFLALAGLIGGGPTFVGTVVGSLLASTFTYILFLSVAGGALIYVTMLMYNAGRRQVTNDLLMLGFFFGLSAGFITDLLVTLGGA